MTDNFSFLGAERHLSSARQVGDVANMLRQQAEEKAIKRMGAEAQIESSKILTDQRQEIEMMRSSINDLLKHNLEQASQQAISSQVRDKIESERYLENLRFTKIAAWTGAIGAILAVVSIAIQLIL